MGLKRSILRISTKQVAPYARATVQSSSCACVTTSHRSLASSGRNILHHLYVRVTSPGYVAWPMMYATHWKMNFAVHSYLV